MTAATQTAPDSSVTLKPLLPCELADSLHRNESWLWHGYLAKGKLTALISPPKSGKTTLLSHLLARFQTGGTLANLAVAPARVLVISEESAGDWDARCQKLQLSDNVRFLCRPFPGARPSDADWRKFIAELESLHRETPFDLVVVDTLAALLPGYAESCAPKLLDCLLPLQALANQGLAVWLLHHPAKGKRADGQASRGSIALAGFVDIVMEMTYVRRPRSNDRRRRLCAYSRYEASARHMILELTPDGADYVLCTNELGIPLVQPWQDVLDILGNVY